ncbi:hypothetical protein MPDQ_007086 [Monascus purpureus]|uniref:Peroxin 26 n=1 Tax=Monascus purpureus TaxID=5098 RepID=A0A507R4D7_MONPU|nr:hypothetical protein MPDQ_007086 [Monascus purpureus]
MTDGGSFTSSQSQLLSSSSSLPPAKLCSKAYKKSSQLYLTRRLQDALSALEPVITVPAAEREQYTNGGTLSPVSASIATVPSTWRIKVWNLYIALLSAIVDLGPEEGKQIFGQKEWKEIAAKVRDGNVWQTVVQTGYHGIEGAVDADVVYNLATLLLNHSPSQTLNQQRIETYLSSYGQSSLDIPDNLQQSSLSDVEQRQAGPGSGTSTPKDLAARVRIIELFTLHVLPRNNEWEYARDFISLSDVLDEERKEAFLQALENLKEEKEMGELRAAEIQRGKEAEMAKHAREAERRMAEEAAAAAPERSGQNGLRRASSEVDFGIEKNHPNGTLKGKGAKSERRQSGTKTATAPGRSTVSASSSSSKNVKKSEKPRARPGQLRALTNAIRNLLRHIAQAASSNPLSVFRTLVFILGIIMAFSKQNVRERVGKITGAGWQKVKGTIGMGVKVSYI